MILLAKIIHFLSFSVGIGGGVANMVIGIRARSSAPEMRPVFAGIQKTLGAASFIGLVLLWVTGIYMVYAVHQGWSGLGTAFWIKIAAVVVLTLAGLTAQYVSATAKSRNPATMGPLMAKIGMTATTAAIAALIFAAIAFT